jgi:hypothetical protein
VAKPIPLSPFPRQNANRQAHKRIFPQLFLAEAENLLQVQVFLVGVPQTKSQDAGIDRWQEILLVDEEPGG